MIKKKKNIIACWRLVLKYFPIVLSKRLIVSLALNNYYQKNYISSVNDLVFLNVTNFTIWEF